MLNSTFRTPAKTLWKVLEKRHHHYICETVEIGYYTNDVWITFKGQFTESMIKEYQK